MPMEEVEEGRGFAVGDKIRRSPEMTISNSDGIEICMRAFIEGSFSCSLCIGK